MNHRFLIAGAVAAAALTGGLARASVFDMPSGQTSLQFVTIGSPGNAPDTTVESDGTSGYGSVPYDYKMGEYDVTIGQYCQFLDAVAATADPDYFGFRVAESDLGDAAGDGTVDINDLTIVLTHFGQSRQTWSDGEFTGDGTVDINDLTIVLANFGRSTGAGAAGLAAVPEPDALALVAAAALAGLAACARRRGEDRPNNKSER
jgi:hypothetical protein